MSFVICHILVFAVFNDHFEHPFHFPSCLVKKIGITVGIFRHKHTAVAVDIFITVFERSLILILHHPEGKSAVYYIFSMISGIVPTAGNVNGLAGSAAFPVGHDLGIVCGMTGGSCEFILVAGGNVLTFYFNAASVLVEVVQRIIKETGVYGRITD